MRNDAWMRVCRMTRSVQSVTILHWGKATDFGLHVAVVEEIGPVTVLLIGLPFALVHVAVCVGACAEAVARVVFPAAIVHNAALACVHVQIVTQKHCGKAGPTYLPSPFLAPSLHSPVYL